MSEPVRESVLFRTVSDLVTDLADLFQKELQLAKAEITENVSRKVQASVWLIAAGVLGFLAVILLLEAIVFALIAAGMGPAWACLLVMVVLAAAAAIAFFKGRADAEKSLAPERTIHQIKEDIKVTKEQLT